MKRTILLADDQRGIRQFCKQELESAGFRVVPVEDGDEALDTLESIVVDLVILDEHMPRCSGREAARQIKQLLPNLPVILFTADPLYERYRRPWIDAVVTKSEDLALLQGEIARLLASAADNERGAPTRAGTAASGADELAFPVASDGGSPSVVRGSRERRPTYA